MPPTTDSQAPTQAADNRNIDQIRVRYGFWIIFTAFGLVLATIVICVETFFTANESVAVIGTVTGLVGTVVATWFNISANTSVMNRVLQNQAGAAGDGAAAIPVITSLRPDTGAAGILVTILGQHFTGTTVKFAGVESPLTHVVSDTVITAMTPGVKAGPADVVVVTRAGMSATGTATKFTFKGLGLAKIDPPQAKRGEKITLYGSGFTDKTKINFVPDGSSKAPGKLNWDSTFTDETTITVNVPDLGAPPDELPLQVHITVTDGTVTTPTSVLTPFTYLG
jgi:hypothetical protein